MKDSIQSVSILYEYGVPGVKIHYEHRHSRTLSHNEAIRFVQLMEKEHLRRDIRFLDTGRLRRYVAAKYFS